MNESQKYKIEMEAAAEAPAPAGLKSIIQGWWSQCLSNRRRIGTFGVAAFALLVAWHVVMGQNGLSIWQQKRAEDKMLAQEIDRLSAENDRLSQHAERLKSDPAAIEHEARERFHYARPNEIIYALPQTPESAKPASKLP